MLLKPVLRTVAKRISAEFNPALFTKSCLTYALKLEQKICCYSPFSASVSQLVLMGFEVDGSSSFGLFKCRLHVVLAC